VVDVYRPWSLNLRSELEVSRACSKCPNKTGK
jgi:hypothetical protein